MNTALKLERDPLSEVAQLLKNSLGIVETMRRVSGERREKALRVLHMYASEAADKAFALIPRPPVTRKPDHAWLSLNGGLVHAFPRDESGTYGRSACGAVRKRRGNWQPMMAHRSCKRCARMVAG